MTQESQRFYFFRSISIITRGGDLKRWEKEKPRFVLFHKSVLGRHVHAKGFFFFFFVSAAVKVVF